MRLYSTCFFITGLSPVGASVPRASQWTTCDQGGEREAEADQWRVSTGAGAHQPRADLGSGPAECAAGSSYTASWGEGNVSYSYSFSLRLRYNSNPDYLASQLLVSCLLVRMQSHVAITCYEQAERQWCILYTRFILSMSKSWWKLYQLTFTNLDVTVIMVVELL